MVMRIIIGALALAGCAQPAPPANESAAGDAAAPVVTSFEALAREQLTPDIVRQALHGETSTFSRWTLKAGSGVPMHSHPNEQVTVILSGRSIVRSGDQTFHLKAGDVLLFPPNVEHEFSIIEDAVVLDFFAPRRQDWIDAARAGDE
ncbi:MAG TPA: cupin domain-containing protein [Parvularculaceae bacterium]|nr:cupin domain-containing protein [Parvularculaceae bacterium]